MERTCFGVARTPHAPFAVSTAESLTAPVRFTVSPSPATMLSLRPVTPPELMPTKVTEPWSIATPVPRPDTRTSVPAPVTVALSESPQSSRLSPAPAVTLLPVPATTAEDPSATLTAPPASFASLEAPVRPTLSPVPANIARLPVPVTVRLSPAPPATELPSPTTVAPAPSASVTAVKLALAVAPVPVTVTMLFEPIRLVLLPVPASVTVSDPDWPESRDTTPCTVPPVPLSVAVHMGAIPDAPAMPFRWGLAYPLSGEIFGTGVGSIRRGVFSTGVAYERVTEWVPEEKLSFIVLSDPPTMHELSPYAHVNAPHVSGYFRTIDARFTLARLADGKTRLMLTTRHELELEPALYWSPLAQWAVHANKIRVLAHFRQQAEASIVGQ